MFNINYIRNQENIKTRALSRILKDQKNLFTNLLEKENKAFGDDIVEEFMDGTYTEIPAYLVNALPTIMNRGMNDTKKDYKKELGDDYSLSFDIETSPASEYIRNLEDLHLSQKQGSINKTTRDELRKIIADGIDDGLSYGQIAKQIRETDPFVFSKARAELIAIQEVGQAYGFGNYQPYKDMASEGLEFEKRWITSHDGKVRATHKDNEAQGWIPLSENFSGTGDESAPSKDFRCRCYMETRIVSVKNIEVTEIKSKIFLNFKKKENFVGKLQFKKKLTLE